MGGRKERKRKKEEKILVIGLYQEGASACNEGDLG